MRDKGVILGRRPAFERARPFHRRCREPLRGPDDLPCREARKESARRGRVHPDPVRLQPGPLQGVHGGGHGQGPRRRRSRSSRGVTPLKSARMAEYMAKNVAGMDIPEEVIARMKGVPAGQQRAEGIKIAVETIEALKEHKRRAGRAYHGDRVGRGRPRACRRRRGCSRGRKAKGGAMPAKYHISTQPVPSRFPPVIRSGVIAWEEGCLKCVNMRQERVRLQGL